MLRPPKISGTQKDEFITTIIVEPVKGLPTITPVLSYQDACAINIKVADAGEKRELVVGKDYPTIQAAIAAATAGQTIRIMPGTYNEALVMKSGITLLGESDVIVETDANEAVVLDIQNCDGVVIKGITFRNFASEAFGANEYGMFPVVQAYGSSGVITDCVISNSACSGIVIGSANNSKFTVQNCSVLQNKLAGIQCRSKSNVVLFNNVCSENSENGIYMMEFASGKIINNNCSKNKKHGISITDSVSGIAVGNNCSENSCSGIYMGSNSDCVAQNNTCSNNTGNGICVFTGNVILSGNQCSNNGINGIFLNDLAVGSAGTNRCWKNQLHGISKCDGCWVRIRGNECFNNVRCGFYGSKNGKFRLLANTTYDNGEFSFGEIHFLVEGKKISELDQMASRIRQNQLRFTNGDWQMPSFCTSATMGYGDPNKVIAFYNKWLSSDPNSTNAKLLLAYAYYFAAWEIRGTGWSHQVSPSAFDKMQKHLLAAERILEEQKKSGITDPEFYTVWIYVATGLEKSSSELDDLFYKGTKLNQTYYSLYFARSTAHQEKWFGEKGDLEKFARKAASMTSGTDSNSLYYLLACDDLRWFRIAEFKNQGYDYKLLLSGYNDHCMSYPESQNPNNILLLTYIFNDKEKAKNLLIEIGPNWSRYIWENQANFELVRKWAITNSDQ